MALSSQTKYVRHFKTQLALSPSPARHFNNHYGAPDAYTGTLAPWQYGTVALWHFPLTARNSWHPLRYPASHKISTHAITSTHTPQLPSRAPLPSLLPLSRILLPTLPHPIPPPPTTATTISYNCLLLYLQDHISLLLYLLLFYLSTSSNSSASSSPATTTSYNCPMQRSFSSLPFLLLFLYLLLFYLSPSSSSSASPSTTIF